jgi:hypothetical protein
MNPIKKGAEAKASAPRGTHLPTQSHSINRNEMAGSHTRSRLGSHNKKEPQLKLRLKRKRRDYLS